MPKKGFTLVELLLSLSLAIVLLISFYYAFGSELRYLKKINREIESLQIANMVRERINREIRNSQGLLSNSSASQLRLNYGADTLSYDLFAQKVRRTKNTSVGYLTEVGEIKSLSFTYLQNDLIEVELDGLQSKALIRN